MFVPVCDSYQKPLMPTTPARARRWIKSGKATAFWEGGMFCVRLNVEPSDHVLQPIALGIDPGSKRAKQEETSPFYESQVAVETAPCALSLSNLSGKHRCG
jgi:hypothetical protein